MIFNINSTRGHTGSLLVYINIILAIRLYRRPATEDYLLCHTGTLALRVHVVMPGCLHQTFICCVCIDRQFDRCVYCTVQPACDSPRQ